MFDYHAGEKYKFTLIMVAVTGFIAGVFITSFLFPPAPPQQATRQRPKWADHPDVTGKARPMTADGRYATDGVNTMPPGAEAYNPADERQSLDLINEWLPVAWDLSAGSASNSQEKFIQLMTPECAHAYRQNIWTQDMAMQVEQSGLRSAFTASHVTVGAHNQDGTVVILVRGEQILDVPGKGQQARAVNVEYLVKNTSEGLRIAGISESNS